MKKCLLVLYLCLFIVMIGFGLTLPILPFYIERLALVEKNSLLSAPVHVGALTGIFALMQFFVAPLWGRLSDRLGRRRPFLIFGLTGNAFSLIFFGLGTNLFMLYAARILNGIFAAAVLPIASAYVADVTSEKMRARGMAWLGAAISLGIVAGPLIGAFLSRLDWHTSLRFGPYTLDSFSIPFIVAALLTFLTLFIVWRWLPESLLIPCVKKTHKEKVTPQSMPRLEIWKTPLTKWLAFSFLGQFTLALFEGTFALHAQKVLNFGPAEMGVVFVVCGLVMGFTQGTMVSWFIERVGEKTLLPIGFGIMGFALLLLMMTHSLIFILIYVSFFALGMAILAPSISVLVTKVMPKQLGEALGLQNSANSLGQATGPFIGGLLFVWQIHLPYILTALMLILTATGFGWTMLRQRIKPLKTV